MLFRSHKTLCGTCTSVAQWLTGLTLLIVGVIGLLDQFHVFAVTPWGWVWPVVVLVWGLVVLFTVGCKECSK